MFRCCYCGMNNTDATKIVAGHRTICDECKEKNQPLIASSKKSNHKRVINQFKKKIQKKRKVNVNRQIVSSDEEPEYDSDDETLSDDSEHAPISSLKKNDISETDTDSEEDENKKICRSFRTA